MYECIFLDVSGGASYSILDEMRSVLRISNCLSFTRDNYTPLSYKDVFHMATLGGAKGKIDSFIFRIFYISIYKMFFYNFIDYINYV